jgi:voltage-gated potassium channel
MFTLGLVIVGGFLGWAIEPEIETVWDGIWWSLITVTTVGYGDIAPKTPIGRGLAAVLILVGLCTLSLLTGAITTYALRRQRSADAHIAHIIVLLERWEELSPSERQHAAALLQMLADE